MKRGHARILSKGVRLVALFGAFVLSLWLIYIFFILQPNNGRDWEAGMEHLPDITMADNSVVVEKVRDFDHASGSFSYTARTFDINTIARVWFIQEPFTIEPFGGFKGVAHTYFVFDFAEQAPLAISVEARREKGEAYNAGRGLFNQYELIYIWGAEEDLTVRRVVLGDNKLYMYPLILSRTAAQRLFIQLASASQQLETRPRFYNTLTSNCTNELARVANSTEPGAIPPDLALIFPGFSDELLYKLGFIRSDAPLDELRNRYYISDVVKGIYQENEFARLLRSELQDD
jgi:hypothetical protein